MKLGSTKLPTRVIAVSSTDATGPCVFASDGAVAPYSALSYCWGHNQDCKTTKATLASYSKTLPLERLPQTILDAISVTRELGIPYLWVDALCIVQDDEGDVAAELSRMAQIYRDAYVTISAAGAEDSRDGFLADRKLTSVVPGGPIYLPYRTAVGATAAIGTVGLLKNSVKGIVRDPIHARAWTMQEHMLAPRLLVYGSAQLFRICGSRKLCSAATSIRSESRWTAENGSRYMSFSPLLGRLRARSMASSCQHPSGQGPRKKNLNQPP